MKPTAADRTISLFTGQTDLDVRRAHDFYETPPEVTKSILQHLPMSPVLDPCVGDRAIVNVIAEEWRVDVYGIDIDPARASVHNHFVGDALDPSNAWPVALFPLVITNPPYKFAEAFVQRALAAVAPVRGTVAMLLRLPFLASRRRVGFHRAHPADVFVLSARPSFTGDGRTDATEYAWFVWGPGRGGHWFVLGGES